MSEVVNKYNMKCTPECTYFPCMDCRDWTIDKDGIKRRVDGKEYVCGYDGHLIKSWKEECPKDRDGLELLKEKRR